MAEFLISISLDVLGNEFAMNFVFYKKSIAKIISCFYCFGLEIIRQAVVN